MVKRKRFLSVLVTIAMVMSLLTSFTLGAGAASEVSYVDRIWDEANSQVVETIKSITDYTEVDSRTTSMTDGWYVVKEDVTVTERISVTGAVNLILADGAHLTADKGVSVLWDNTLNIYGQSEDSGSLTATTNSQYHAAIGADGGYIDGKDLSKSGLIVIKGGRVEAHSLAVSRGGAGIGGGDYTRNGSIRGIEIYGGYVNASCHSSADAIGYGFSYSSRTGDVKIYGGNVTAKTKYLSPPYQVHIRLGSIKGGIVTQGNETVVYSSMSVDEDITVASDMSYVIPNGISVTIAKGVTFAVEGTLTVDGVLYNEGSLVNNGTITNNGEIYSSAAISGTGEMNGEGLLRLILHRHSWTDFKADGNIITATCSNEDGNCEMKNASAKLIAPENAVYNGTAYTAILENTFPADVFVDVVYTGDNLTDGKSVNAGSYTASITIGGATVAVDYEIAKAEPLAEHFVNDSIRYYNGEKKTASVKVKDGIAGMGEIKNVEVIGDAVEEGTYPIVFEVSEGENFLAAQFDEGDNFTLVIYVCPEHQFSNGQCTLCGNVCPHTNMSDWASFLDEDKGVDHQLEHKRQCPDCGLEEYESHKIVAVNIGAGFHQDACFCNYRVIGAAMIVACSGGTATCNTLAVCDECKTGYGKPNLDAHEGYVNGICACGKYEEPQIKDGYYQIENPGHMFWFAEQVNVFGNREIKGVLTKDIDLESRPWTPIGTTGESNNNFRGVFDGQGHTIKGLYVTGAKNGMGFFGEARTGTVKNFTIYGEVTVTGKYAYVGGVIGSACGVNVENDLERNGAIIQNITSYVNVTTTAHGIGRIGGFMGYANHETLVENCSWYGTLDLGEYRAEAGVGGFIGRVQENSDATIRNCAAYGTVKTNYKKGTYNNNNDIFIGGFTGWSVQGSETRPTNTIIENCLFAGSVELGENITDKIDYSAFGCLSEIKSITNCCYLDENGLPGVNNNSTYKPSATEVFSVSKQQLESGEAAYLLGDVYGQTIGTDDYPILGGGKVYKYADEYSNELKFGFADYTADGAKINIPEAGEYTLIFADYDGGSLKDLDIVTVTVTDEKIGEITKASEKGITPDTDDKLMLWQDITAQKPICEAYFVK